MKKCAACVNHIACCHPGGEKSLHTPEECNDQNGFPFFVQSPQKLERWDDTSLISYDIALYQAATRPEEKDWWIHIAYRIRDKQIGEIMKDFAQKMKEQGLF